MNFKNGLEKKRAFVVQISGIKYESFVADYIFFCQKAYPESTVIILAENKLAKKTTLALQLLEDAGFKFVIKFFDFRSYLKMDTSLHKKIIYKSYGLLKGCGRFLIDIPEFHEFDEIYIGDVDLFIMREKENLFDMHSIHSRFIKLPYSDILRIPFEYTLTLSRRFKAFIKFGFSFLKSIKNKPTHFLINRMTGLRYIKVEEYYKKVAPYFNIFINYFGDLFSLSTLKEKKSQILTIDSFDDQQILCMLMEKAFGYLPKHASCDGIDIHNPNSFDFRPHHGIHIKLFFNLKNLNKRIILSNDYTEYFYQYSLLINDPYYLVLSEFRFGLCKKLTKNLNVYLERRKAHDL